jgi:hypothetical protein
VPIFYTNHKYRGNQSQIFGVCNSKNIYSNGTFMEITKKNCETSHKSQDFLSSMTFHYLSYLKVMSSDKTNSGTTSTDSFSTAQVLPFIKL